MKEVMRADERAARFLRAYLNKGVDYDKAFGNQCVDIYRQYAYDNGWAQYPPMGSGGAKSIRAMPALDGKVGQTETDLPAVGDVVIYDATQSNPYGHVAVCVATLPGCHIVIEQNGFDPQGLAYLAKRENESILRCIRRNDDE
jgi:hypothetical protein